MLLVDGTHECSRWRQHLIDEYKDCLLGWQLNPFADNVDKLSDCQIGRNQILLLINGWDIGPVCLLADDRNAIWILLTNTLSLGLALLEGVFILKLGPHDDWD